MPARPSIPFLLDLLRLAMRKEASAVYIVPWMPPTLRIDERSVPLSSVAFTPAQATMLVLDVLDEAQRAALDRSREIQFSFELEALGRFRVHAFRRHGQPAMAIRPYAVQPPTPRTLALPALACTAALAERGLLLLASRSPTLRRDTAAALIEHRNRHGSGELVLLDDASRFWHERSRCTVRQGLNPAALDELLQRRGTRAPGQALAAEPLAIAWGELRDGPQLERVVRAAERALCVATLPADTALAALQRLLALAEEADGSELRRRAALALHGLLVLRPVPAAQGGNDLAATEVVMNSPALAADLSEGDLPALQQQLPGPGGADDHLWQLVVQGLVRQEDAQRHAGQREAFARRKRGEPQAPVPPASAPVTEDGTPPAAPALSPRAFPTPFPVPRPPAPAVKVDSGFADLFDPAAPPSDPFDFAESPAAGRAEPRATKHAANHTDHHADTQFDGVDWAGHDPPPAPAAATPTSAQAAQFHAWAPPALVPGHDSAIDLWVALPSQVGELAARARVALALAAAPLLPQDGTPIVTLQLRIDGLMPSSPVQQLAWTGRPARVRVPVPVPPEARPGPHAARVRLLVGPVPIGELSFVLQVRPGARADAPPEDTQAARRMLRSAYATYAPADLAAVQACVAAAQAVAPELEVFLDAPSLRSVDQWRERIAQECSRREHLLLFWSAAAAESPWVDYEWRLMLRRGGPGLIDAVLLDPPQKAPLPPELADVVSVTELKPRRH